MHPGLTLTLTHPGRHMVAFDLRFAVSSKSHFETGLFKRGESGSARPPRGMKLGGIRLSPPQCSCHRGYTNVLLPGRRTPKIKRRGGGGGRGGVH